MFNTISKQKLPWEICCLVVIWETGLGREQPQILANWQENEPPQEALLQQHLTRTRRGFALYTRISTTSHASSDRYISMKHEI